MSYRKQLPTRRLGLGLVATALLVSSFSFSGALLSQDSPTPDQGDHESHARANNEAYAWANNEAYAWANNPADRKWRVELPVPVRNLLTLTGAGTSRRPEQVDNDPALGLTLAGSTAMFADATGSALWPNCTSIRVTIDTVESSADSTAAALATRDAVTELAELTGLEFTSITASTHTAGDDPAPRSNTIQIIWVDRGTGLLEDHELGSAEVWHLEVIDRLIVFQAVVLLSDGSPNFMDCSMNFVGSYVQHRDLIMSQNSQSARVDTLGIGISSNFDARTFMHAVAAENGGTYTEIN